jgi:hypothetical protein
MKPGEKEEKFAIWGWKIDGETDRFCQRALDIAGRDRVELIWGGGQQSFGGRRKGASQLDAPAESFLSACRQG